MNSGCRQGQYLATPITYLSDVNAIGLDVAHDLTFMQSWYWDLDDRTREFAKRFYARRGRMPNDNQVALYSSVRHYLEAVAKAGTDDSASVMRAMREAPIHDIFTANGTIRADGRVLYDRYLMRVKVSYGLKISVGLSNRRRQDAGRRRVPAAWRRAAASWRRRESWLTGSAAANLMKNVWGSLHNDARVLTDVASSPESRSCSGGARARAG